jgi:4-hydroxy-3-methylbut-2-en-1-yl diphosphate reductase
MVIKLASVDDAGVGVPAAVPMSAGALVPSQRRDQQTLLLAVPRGFCAGVIRAIDTVRAALRTLGPPVYVRREIVHNDHVVQELAVEGAIFVDTLDSVPDGAVLVFSAHGVSPAVREEADQRHLRVIDATCPLVTKVHLEAIRYARENYSIVLIGHPDHDEVVGTAGEAPDAIRVVTSIEDVDRLDLPDATRVVYLTQTTLSLDDTTEIVARLRERFPAVAGPPAQDICYATQNRQNAVKAMAPRVDLLLVVGARNSSNSNRLVEVAARAGVSAHLINGVGSIRKEWLTGCRSIGLTAGASTPDILIEEVVAWLRARGCDRVEKVEVISENIHFALPALGDGAEL